MQHHIQFGNQKQAANRIWYGALIVGLLVSAAAAMGLARVEPDESAGKPVDPYYVLGYEMERLDGELTKLDSYKGKVVLMVNVASRCGLTPQYASLERLYDDHKEQGLVVLGFPANDFLGQEPGTNEQIAQFCEENYGVSFPMFAKIKVKGKDAHPLYRQLSSLPKPLGGEPEWNFAKFLVDREGRVVERFNPRTKPTDPKIVASITRLLEQG